MDPAEMTVLAQQAASAIEFVDRCGFKVIEAERGRCVARIPLEGNVNHVGTMYAGALFTLAEIPGGVVAMSMFDPSRYYAIVKSVEISYRRPATTDITVEVSLDDETATRVQAEVAEHGKADFSWTCELVDTNGTVVATTQNHYQLRTVGS